MRARLAMVLALAALSGCNKGPSREQLLQRVAELEAENSDLQRQLDDVRGKVDDVESASSDLDTAVSRFDSEDWKVVVPDVQEAQKKVESAKDDAVAAAAEQ